MTVPRPPAARIHVFGDLRLLRDGSEVDLGPSRQRLLLAELVAARGRPVSASHLVESLWEEAPPSSAMNQLHRYVGDLRRAFEPRLRTREIGSHIAPTPSGYRLLAGTLSSDLADFYLHAAEAAQLSTAGSLLAVEAYERLLETVVAPAFRDLPFGAASRPEFAQVERDRISVAVAAADHALSGSSTDHLTDLIAQIAETTSADERMQARLMRLLIAQSRLPAALALYDRTRRILADAFGISPGAELSTAHQAALQEDSRAAAAAPTASWGRDNLPPQPVSFLDRPDVARTLDEGSGRAWAGERALVVVSGMAGIGKTSAVISWAHSVESAFPKGRLYVDLRGFTPEGRPLDATAAVDDLLAGLGIDSADSGGDPVQRRATLLRTLASGGYLIVLDNAGDAEQVRPLLPDGRGSMVVVTSRNSLASLVVHEGAAAVVLQRLTQTEATELLRGRLGIRHVEDDRPLRALVAICDGLPLALAIVAARANLQRGQGLADLAAELESSREKLGRLRVDSADSDVRAAFTWSHRLLSPKATALFSRISVHPGPSMSLSAIASIDRRPIREVQGVLDELLAANMLSRASGHLYVLHDLLRLFASELLGEEERRAAQLAFVAYCVATMRATYLTIARIEPVYEMPWTGPATPETFDSDADATIWYRRERQAVLAVMQICRETQSNAEFATILLDSRAARSSIDGMFAAPLAPLEEGLDRATRSGSLALLADAHRDAAFQRSLAGDVAGAQAHIESALATFRLDGNSAGFAVIRRQQFVMAQREGDDQATKVAAELFLNSARAAGRPPLVVDALSMSASAAVALEEWEHAYEFSEDAIAIDPDALQHAVLLANRAIALNSTGRHREALQLIEPRLGPADEDTMWTFGLLVELIVAAGALGRFNTVRTAYDRYQSFMDKFANELAMEAPAEELLSSARRVSAAVARAGSNPAAVPV
jgi:DNA-binding SARP family transcriptional activator/tetratricopeptide (TPR) repeat protein